MKSTIKIQSKRSDAGDGDSFARGLFPQTDYQFQSNQSKGAAIRPPAAELRAFRRLSREYLESDRRNYIHEALLLAILGLVSAWPIARMISALGGLLK